MDTLLTVIVLWLSASFGLPAIEEHPRIALVPPAQIAALRYKGFAGMQPQAGTPGAREVVAVHDDRTRTIYLRDDWTGRTPAEMSVLVHEMVHHLQNVGQLKFDCPQEREQIAYRAQTRWLELYDTDLNTEFDLDPFTLLVSTRCIY
jgi:hypothetical protein